MSEYETLRALGDDADAVAAALEAKGVRGRRGDSCACPLAGLLSGGAAPGERPEVVVGATRAYLRRGHGRQELILPLACADFVRRFDLGLYPRLEGVPRDA